ncbi:DegT/DnrJ/EryC1/StrS aminotransferase family protein [Streptomyces griseiscabiei]|uniref:DegT/DnrJ/EryC1/StrS family aminotransferase n=1 Tax=Streptomyces griseiscabiei TaxID=2993540 RepID=A0ABU4LIV9_9ACTN|nr:DegT/DnrJ/EryC1/StrS family aminotransferase [Streptomyces griseiscabiei]MBZ3907936.1 DegT/DnrJ/EryC1/StrS family aminotransferase [Streptomyces griseiscabiei]MDX2915084.1 DegT/DnrJ/EryC1/StrS family aminotransferase [Streptomyces griseiscabiei]
MINVFQPSLGDEELAAISEVFADNWLGHGPRTRKFEEEFAGHLGVAPEQTLFINSATAGLFLATELLGLGAADDVVLPSMSFVAAANAVAASGARPVFCDVDERTLNPTAAHVQAALTPRTRAVLILHYGGYPGDVEAIAALCRERGITLIEDAACAVASRAGGRACGTFGDIAMWSFDSMKVLVTGDGGMLYVKDPELARRARQLAYHGLEQSSGFNAAKVSHRWWELNVRNYGRRVIGNDVTAAIGSVQLGRLAGFVERRRRIAETYDRLLAGADGIVPPPPLPEGHESSYYFYWVQLDSAIRDQVAADLLDQGVYTTLRYPPLHKVPAYRAGGEILPGTDVCSENTLLLPLHQGLDDAQARTVAAALRASVERRTADAGR